MENEKNLDNYESRQLKKSYNPTIFSPYHVRITLLR